MRIIFTGGGTAGHVTPALSICDAMKKVYPDAKVAFIGRSGGAENGLIAERGYKLYTLSVSGLPRKVSKDTFRKMRQAIKAKADAGAILKDFAPDIVIGTGGYVCWPVIEAAIKAKIPTVLHESNATLGLSARLLAKKVDLLLLGTENQVAKHKNGHYVGNPVRNEFNTIDRKNARLKLGLKKDDKLILSVGGSGGSEILNIASVKLMENYSSVKGSVFHVHSTGRKYFEEAATRHPEFTQGSRGCKIVPFIPDMPKMLYAADLIISRCGAMTLAEIAYTSTPSILIPSPNVTADHQRKNAEHFAKNKAAVIIEEQSLTEERLEDAVNTILTNQKYHAELTKNTRSLAVFDSSSKIVEIIKNELLTR